MMGHNHTLSKMNLTHHISVVMSTESDHIPQHCNYGTDNFTSFTDVGGEITLLFDITKYGSKCILVCDIGIFCNSSGQVSQQHYNQGKSIVVLQPQQVVELWVVQYATITLLSSQELITPITMDPSATNQTNLINFMRIYPVSYWHVKRQFYPQV